MKPEFEVVFERAYQLFKTCPDPFSRQSGQGWCIKEILGHLVDSASNNYQRLQRYVPQGELQFPGYNQEECVRRADYVTFDFTELLSLWRLHNRLLFHLFDNIPHQDLDSKIIVGDNPAMSIRKLMEDYFAHMVLHENQVNDVLAAQSRAD